MGYRSPTRILVVCNSAESRRVYASHLAVPESFDCKVLQADGADSGLALCREEYVDCVVVQDDLLGLSAKDFLSQLRRGRARADVPALCISHREGPFHREALLAAGALDVLERGSISGGDLRRAVYNVLEVARLHRSLLDVRGKAQTPRKSRTTRIQYASPPHKAVSTALFVLDAQGQIVTYDEAACTLLAVSNEELAGEHVSVLFGQQELPFAAQKSFFSTFSKASCGQAMLCAGQEAGQNTAYIIERLSDEVLGLNRFLLTLRPRAEDEEFAPQSPAQQLVAALESFGHGPEKRALSWAHLESQIAELRTILAADFGLTPTSDAPVDLAAMIRHSITNRTQAQLTQNCDIKINIPDPIIGFWNRHYLQHVLDLAIDEVAGGPLTTTVIIYATCNQGRALINFRAHGKEEKDGAGSRNIKPKNFVHVSKVLRRLGGSIDHGAKMQTGDLTIDLPMRNLDESFVSR